MTTAPTADHEAIYSRIDVLIEYTNPLFQQHRRYTYGIGKTLRKYAEKCADGERRQIHQILKAIGNEFALMGWDEPDIDESLKLSEPTLGERVNAIKSKIYDLQSQLEDIAKQVIDPQSVEECWDEMPLEYRLREVRLAEEFQDFQMKMDSLRVAP